MTTQIVSATEVATKPYSAERFAKMDRADRITRILFTARRRGESMTTAQAIEIIDAEIDAANEKKIAADLNNADVVTVAADTLAANDAENNSPEPTSMTFTRDAVHALVADGRFFSVEFIKRTTGESRQMQARLGVTKHLKGGAKQFDDASKNLLTVFSLDANGYRSIPIESIMFMTIKGVKYTAIKEFSGGHVAALVGVAS